MPVQRKHRTPDEIATNKERKREEQLIHPWQVLAMDNLFFRGKAIQDFIVALRGNCNYDAGTAVNINEISGAIGFSHKKTYNMLEQLEYTGIGRLVSKRPIADENRSSARFYWKGDFHELIEKFIEMRERQTDSGR